MSAAVNLRRCLGACWLAGSLMLSCSRHGASVSPATEGQAPVSVEAPGQSPVAAPAASRVERDGLAISFALRPQRGAGLPEAQSDASAVFTITDVATGAPARGLAPLGWMSKRTGAAPDDAGCRHKIKSYSAGLLSVRPEIDMNAYLLWTLNDDNSLSVINPQVAFSKTKVRSVVTLSAQATSFALHPNGDSLYVTLAGENEVAVVDTRRSLVAFNVPVGKAPMRVAVAPDGKTVWVGNDGDHTVSVLDAPSHEVRGTIRVGRGHHEIAFADGGRTAWITSRESETVAVVDTSDLAMLAEVPIGEGAAAIAASDASWAVYVANETRGEVVLLDTQRRAVSKRVSVQRGVSALRFEPKGRFAFALNPAHDEVSILDASTGQLAHTLSGFVAPDVVAFTSAFAYVRSFGANKVSLIDLAALERPGAPSVVDVQAGEQTPQAAPDARFGTPIVSLPDGGGAIFANPADKTLYYYTEGMMAPMGSFSNQGRAPRSALIEDRSLKEVEPGVYATTVRLGEEGTYDTELLLNGRKLAVCLEANVARSPNAPADAAAGVTLEPFFDENVEIEAAKPVTLRFRMQPKAPTASLDAKEVSVMVIRFPEGFRWSGAPQKEADDIFSVTFTPPRSGEYRFLVAAEGRGAPLGAVRFRRLQVTAPQSKESSP